MVPESYDCEQTPHTALFTKNSAYLTFLQMPVICIHHHLVMEFKSWLLGMSLSTQNVSSSVQHINYNVLVNFVFGYSHVEWF